MWYGGRDMADDILMAAVNASLLVLRETDLRISHLLISTANSMLISLPPNHMAWDDMVRKFTHSKSQALSRMPHGPTELPNWWSNGLLLHMAVFVETWSDLVAQIYLEASQKPSGQVHKYIESTQCRPDPLHQQKMMRFHASIILGYHNRLDH